MNITLRMDAKELIERMYMDATADELFDFIKALDARVADYDFTNKLKSYFVEEIQQEDILNTNE
jgi:hypothetical protein